MCVLLSGVFISNTIGVTANWIFSTIFFMLAIVFIMADSYASKVSNEDGKD